MTRRESSRRIRILGAMVMLGVVATGGRALWLGVVRSSALSAEANQTHDRASDIPAERGSIVDRDGRQLAIDKLTADVTATPYLLPDHADVAARLGPVLGVPPATLQATLDKGGGYAVLAKGIDQDTAKRVRDLEIPNVDVEDTYTRYLPLGRVAAQAVGMVGQSGGQSGLEKQYDRVLTGTPGRRKIAHDPLGNILRTLQDKEPVAGQTLHLAMDSVIQRQTEQILAEVRNRYGAKSANAVVMRPRDGAILALATVPRFNPNDRRTYRPGMELNRPISAPFEPGSTFKVVSIGGALQDGKVTPSTRIRVPEVVTLFDRTLRDAHNEGASVWTTTEILERSSNKGTVLIAQKLGSHPVYGWIKRFGFGARTGVDLPGEDPGDVPDVDSDRWSGTSILNIPIGQGLMTTQIQTARAYAAIANGGMLVTPHMVTRIGARPVDLPAPTRIISPRTAHQLDAMLRKAVSDQGTGSAAQVEGYAVAGKTGTASKVDPNGRYSQTRYIASFVGYVPADNPQLVIAVSVDEPKAAIYGGTVAAPAFEQIAKFSLLRLEIPPA